jgi:hypothetical protein
MKKRLLFILCFIIGLGNSALAQKAKTVTNAELEKYRQKRVQSEKDLRENYQKLGFPSPEELEKRNAEKRASMEEVAEQLREEQLQKQNEIVAQANALRLQIASVDAQINYLRSQVGSSDWSNQGVFLSYGYAAPYYGGGYRGGRLSYRQPKVLLPQNMQAVQDIARMYPNSQDVYNRAIGRYAFQNQRPIGRGGYGRGYYRGGYGGGYAVGPVIVGGGYSEPGYLETQLITLEQQRAGLLAQWAVLEDQARRAGIKID